MYPAAASAGHRDIHLQDGGEWSAPPGPDVVGDDVGRAGDERRVVCVELARLVIRTGPLPAWTHESTLC